MSKRRGGSLPRVMPSLSRSSRRAHSDQKPGVLILTPAYDGRLSGGYVDSLMRTLDLLRERGISCDWCVLAGCSLLPAARNSLACQFLARPEFDHALWIDSDMEWQPSDVLRLLDHDVEIAAGVGCTRSAEVDWEYGGRARQAAQNPGLVEVDHVGFGFVLTRRSVFERLAEAYPERRIVAHAGMYGVGVDQAWPSQPHDFFPFGFLDGAYVSEDVGFCRIWRKIGGRVLIDPSIRLVHLGMHAFEGDPMTAFAPAPRVGEAA